MESSGRDGGSNMNTLKKDKNSWIGLDFLLKYTKKTEIRTCRDERDKQKCVKNNMREREREYTNINEVCVQLYS